MSLFHIIPLEPCRGRIGHDGREIYKKFDSQSTPIFEPFGYWNHVVSIRSTPNLFHPDKKGGKDGLYCEGL